MKKTLSLFVLSLASFAAVAGSSPGPVVEEKPLVFDTLKAAVLVAGRLAVATAEKFGSSPNQVIACGADNSNTIVVRASSIGNEAFVTITQTGENSYAVERGAKREAGGDKCTTLNNDALLKNMRGKS